MTDLFVNSYRTQKELLAILTKEVHPNITLTPWEEEKGVTGFFILSLPEGITAYDTYVVLNDLNLPMTYINVPIEFQMVTGFNSFTGEKTYKTQREPLCTWKTIPVDTVGEPVSMYEMMGKVAEKYGLGYGVIAKNEKLKTSAPLGISEREKKIVKNVWLFEVYTDKHLNKPQQIIELECLPHKEDPEDLKKVQRIFLADLITQGKFKYAMTKFIGDNTISQYLTKEEVAFKKGEMAR